MLTAKYFVSEFKKEAREWHALAKQATSDKSQQLRLYFAEQLEQDAQIIEQNMLARKWNQGQGS